MVTVKGAEEPAAGESARGASSCDAAGVILLFRRVFIMGSGGHSVSEGERRGPFTRHKPLFAGGCFPLFGKGLGIQQGQTRLGTNANHVRASGLLASPGPPFGDTRIRLIDNRACVSSSLSPSRPSFPCDESFPAAMSFFNSIG